MSNWKNETFTELMRTQGMRQAFEYRLETLGTPIPEEHLTDEEKKALLNPEAKVELETPVVPETPVSTTDEALKKEYTVDEVKVLLTEKGIKFHHMAGPAKIMELAIANNLI